MIRLVLVDDHPALRAGLLTVLRGEPGLVPVGAAAGEHELWPLLRRTKPDVILMDYHLPGADGFVLCHRLKRSMPPVPRVIIYSAYAGAPLLVPALLAGADGVINKGAPANELFEMVRAVARGDNALPDISAGLLVQAGETLEPRDRPIVPMLVDGTPYPEIAEALGIERKDLDARIETMLERLSLDVPGREGG